MFTNNEFLFNEIIFITIKLLNKKNILNKTDRKLAILVMTNAIANKNATKVVNRSLDIEENPNLIFGALMFNYS